MMVAESNYEFNNCKYKTESQPFKSLQIEQKYN